LTLKLLNRGVAEFSFAGRLIGSLGMPVTRASTLDPMSASPD
jgi:hypothetical protein